MNIFYLHENLKICAEMHLDKHASKMCIEYAQLLSTAHRVLDGTEYYGKTKTGRKAKRYKLSNKIFDDTLYLASHINHPCGQWVRESKRNYNWLYQLWIHLGDEFKKRYSGKEHSSLTQLKSFLRFTPKNMSDGIFTEPPQAMPEDVKVNGNSIQAYRNYYIYYKRGFATWNKTQIPQWYKEAM